MNKDQLEIVLKEVLEEMQKTNHHLASQYAELQEIKEIANNDANQQPISERLGLILSACQRKPDSV